MTSVIDKRKERIELLKQKIWVNSPISLETLSIQFSFEHGVSVDTVKDYVKILLGMGYIKINDGILFKKNE
jgi:hypothetical protein